MPQIFEFMTTKWFLQKISKLRKDEIALSALLLVLTFVLNVLYIRKFYGVYCPLISGYDPYLLSTLTNWIHSPYLNSNSIYSHPGLGLLMAPLSVLNYILSSIAGSNCADFVLAIILMTMFILETILIKRIINEYIGLKLALSLILSIFFSGMSYVLLMSFTPDHFAFSQFFLIVFVYLWIPNRQKNRKKIWFLTMCIGCITITNGIKVILSKLFFERRQFIKYLFLYTILLSLMILFSLFLTRNIVYSTNKGEMAYLEQEYKASVNYKHYYNDKADIESKSLMLDSTQCEKYRQAAFAELDTHYSSLGGDNLINKIKSIYWGYKYWITTDVPRTNSFINNLFGQSILFHSNSLNKDNISMGWYPELWKNILNVLFIIMVICGIVLSIKTKLMQLLLCFLSIDIFIHLVCCFGISEIYIYSPHYLFIFVISTGFLIKHTVGLVKKIVTTTIVLMTFTLYINNISEIINYLGIVV